MEPLSFTLSFTFPAGRAFDLETVRRVHESVLEACQSSAPAHIRPISLPTKRTAYDRLVDDCRRRLEAGDIDKEGWGNVAVEELTDALATLPRNQRRVVLRAIENGGHVSRAEALDLVGRDENQNLKSFTKPTKHVMTRLGLGVGASPLLRPIYDDSTKTYTRTQGFTVPLEIVVKMRAASAKEA